MNKFSAVLASVLMVGSAYASSCGELCSKFSQHSVENISSDSASSCHEATNDQRKHGTSDDSKRKSCLGDLCLSFEAADLTQKVATLEKTTLPEEKFITDHEFPVFLKLMRSSPTIAFVDRSLWVSSVPIFLRIHRFLI